jgi:hypothetical protein
MLLVMKNQQRYGNLSECLRIVLPILELKITGGQQGQQVLVDQIRRFFTGWVKGNHLEDQISELTQRCGWKSGTMFSCNIIELIPIHSRHFQHNVWILVWV